LLEVISQTENDKKSLMLVGHNPGFEELLHSLTGTEETFPTAALAKINLKISKWSEPLSGKATVEWIVRPKELEHAAGEGERE
jgi:phosphohistidine phosphatase